MNDIFNPFKEIGEISGATAKMLDFLNGNDMHFKFQDVTLKAGSCIIVT